MMKRMRIQPDANIFAELISCAGDSHVPNKIPGLFRQMMDNYQVQPNEAVFEAAICSYGKCNQWRRALNCWNEMTMNDFSKSQQSYNHILDACMRDFVYVGVADNHVAGWEAELVLGALRSPQFKSARQITASMIAGDVFRSLCTSPFELNLLGMSPGSACLALHWYVSLICFFRVCISSNEFFSPDIICLHRLIFMLHAGGFTQKLLKIFSSQPKIQCNNM
jgi:pentatricopeptide repeat protein